MIPGCRTCEGGFHDYCENNRECACCYHCPGCDMQTRVGEMHRDSCQAKVITNYTIAVDGTVTNHNPLPQWVREREQA